MPAEVVSGEDSLHDSDMVRFCSVFLGCSRQVSSLDHFQIRALVSFHSQHHCLCGLATRSQQLIEAD